MLVRRRVLDELGGLDDELPIFGNDLDFGWRAAAAGHRTVVVPQAVVFHAEAAHRGLRRTPLTGRHTHYQERRAALFTLLANSRSRVWPLQAVRLAFGTLRPDARLPGDPLARGRPRRPRGVRLGGRAARATCWRPGGPVAPRPPPTPTTVKELLAPRWLPYRHGLDAVIDLATALTQSASDVAERRRAAAAERDPSSFAARRTTERERLEDEEVVEDTGLVARFLTNPVAVLLAVTVLAMLVGARSALGHVSGPGLSPAPNDWTRLVVAAPVVLARARARHRGARAAVRAADGAAGHRPRRQPGRGGVGGAGAGGAVRAVGGVAVPARRRPARHPGRCEPLADPVGCHDVRAWCRSSPARGARAASALVLSAALLPWLGARRPRLRRPGVGPTLARGLAHRAAARPGQPAARRWPGWSPRSSASSWCCSRSRCCPASAGTGRPGVRRSSRWPWSRCCSRRGGSRRCCTAPVRGCCSTAGCCRPRPRTALELGLGRFHDLGAPWWLGVVLPVLAALALVPAPDPDPGADLLGGRAAGRGPRGRRARGRSRSTWPRCPPRRASASCWWSCRRRWSPRSSSARSALAPPHGALRAVAVLLVAGRRRRTARRAGLVRARRRRPPDRRPGRRHPGVHGAELGARPGARDPRAPRLGGGRADLHRAS